MSYWRRRRRRRRRRILSGTQQNIQREAPGVESRNLHLHHVAKLAAQPVVLPGIQVAPATGLGTVKATQGQTGVGAPTL